MIKKINLVWGILMILIILNTSFVLSSDLVYRIEIRYDSGNLEIKNVNVEAYNWKMYNFYKASLNSSTIKILDGKGNLMYEEDFSIPNIVAVDDYDEEGEFAIEGGIIEAEEVDFELFVPYFENAKEIVIYNYERKERFKRDVKEFSKIKEEILNDEKIKEIVKDKKVVNYEKEGLDEYVIVLLIVLGVTIIILVYLFTKKDKPKR